MIVIKIIGFALCILLAVISMIVVLGIAVWMIKGDNYSVEDKNKEDESGRLD